LATATVANKNEIAGRLNSDSLISAFNQIGWQVYPENADSSWIDIFDRTAWEQKNVDYKNYRFLIWSDGDDKQLKRYELINLKDYLASGTTAIGGKKNIAIGSQEFLRQNYTQDYKFTSVMMRADTTTNMDLSQALLNPLGDNVSYDGKKITGKSIRTYFVDPIKATGNALDQAPYCGLMKIYQGAEGDARRAYTYNTRLFVANKPLPDSTAGVTTRALTRNVVLLGVDWRHFGNLANVILGLYDFYTPEDLLPAPVGPISVELTSFDADYRNRNVELVWATSSEVNSSKFEVERKSANESGFVKVAELKAVGTEKLGAQYGPVIDNTVVSGRTYQYRLRMVDLDGSYKYSKIEDVTIPSEAEWIGNAMPNPAVSTVEFEFNTNGAATQAEIFDFSGNVASTIQIANGAHTVSADVTNFVPGVYTIVIKSGDSVLRKQFVVVK
jgi:hypothetical protein